MAQSVVVLERDPGLARTLEGELRSHFTVHVTRSHQEVRDHLISTLAEAAVLNIEELRLTDIESLRREFPALLIVCTHRIPDEEMWMAALGAGATDVCPVDDAENVVNSVRRSMSSLGSAAA